jgi:prepilin-type processing-associated H-X9-DG protein
MMIIRSKHDPVEAFTRVELLVIIVVVVVLGALLIPALERAPARAVLINCTNNLKHIGAAIETWAIDHNDKYPMDLSVTNGGTLETTASNGVVSSFIVLSNQLSAPEFLACPADTRMPAANFDPGLSNTNISYFLALNADEEMPEMFLAGDRNLTNGLPVVNGILLLPTNRPVGWDSRMHNGQGNVGLADGSVQQVSSARLWQQLCATETSTNRLLMP